MRQSLPSGGRLKENRVLVVGLPRAGTTWVGQTLRRTEGASFVGEPDNERKEPYALRGKRGLGRFPALKANDEAPEFAHLWDLAFEGRVSGKRYREMAARRLLARVTQTEIRAALCGPNGHRSARLRLVEALAPAPGRAQDAGNVVVKSVYAPLCLEWLNRRYEPRVVIVLRHPLNVISSWLALGYRDSRLDENSSVRRGFVEPLGLPLPGRTASPLARVSWEVGLLTSALEDAATKHPGWLTVTHERLCEDALGEFERLSGRLGLNWAEPARRFVIDSNRPGSGYAPQRVAHEQPQRWRSRLSDEQVSEIASVLHGFPLRTWTDEPVIGRSGRG